MLSKKRILALIMAVPLAFGLASCGKSSSSTTPPPATTAPAQSQTDKTAEPAASEPASDDPYAGMDNNAKGLSKYAEPITVTYVRNVDPTKIFAPGQSYEKNIWMTEYLDVLGINAVLLWEAEGYETFRQKMTLSIASDDLPDVFTVDNAQLTSLINGNRIWDLQPVLDEWATDFYRDNLYADEGLSMEQSTYGGKLMAIPRSGVTPGGYHIMLIRDDWRQQLGLPEPTTFDDMVNLARAFADADLGGVDAYGFAIGSDVQETWFNARGLVNAFGAYQQTWIEKNGKLEYSQVQPEMKNALAVLRDWYTEGLIDSEYATKGSWQMYPDAVAGRSGILFGEAWVYGWPMQGDGVRIGQDWKPYAIPFHESAPQKKYAAKAAVDGGFVVNAKFDHPEALIKMCNLFQDRVLSGREDTWKYKADDMYTYEDLSVFQPTNGIDRNARANYVINRAIDENNPGLIENVEQQQWYQEVYDYVNNQVNIEFVPARPAGEEENPDYVDPEPVKYTSTNDQVWAFMTGKGTLSFESEYSDEIVQQMVSRYTANLGTTVSRYGPKSIYGISNYIDDNDLLIIDKYIGPLTDSMQQYDGQLMSDFNEMFVNIVTGAEPLDYFDTFVANWWKNGGQEITDDVNAWYASTK